MTDNRPVQWVFDTVDCGSISFSEKSGGRRKVCSWQLTNQKQIRAFLKAIRPYLKLKSDQVDVLLAFWDAEDLLLKGHGSVTQEVVETRSHLVNIMKNLKRAVHDVEGVETRRAGTSIH